MPVSEPFTVDDPVAFVGGLMKSALQGGVTQESVAAVEKLVGLFEKMDAKRAEQKFNAAFVALQSDLPVIVASSIIPNRGKYEKFEDVMRQIGPLLTKHGFAVSFDQKSTDGRICEVCTLFHSAGHSRSNEFTVRAGGRADSETQADCKAATTAKRNALLNCLNIVIRQDCLSEDDDAGIEGSHITKEKAEEISKRVKYLQRDEAKFLKWAGSATFQGIMSNRLNEIEDELCKLEKKAVQGLK
ncbi:MAG TPA: ERF family protein [Candidatus Limnocylindrales bacterium]|nr:ERF family protein [Candidatus Limnocylindrales bacterium]